MDYQYEDQEMIYIPKDIRESLIRYAQAEAARINNPDLPINWKSIAVNILRNEVQKRGYYVGKEKSAAGSH